MTVDDFAEFCSELVLENGRQMELHGFQRQMLGPYFAGSRELVVIAPKKQGKTVLLAALGLAHLLETADASVYIVASSRDQAGLIFDAMVGFVRRTEQLRDQVIIRRGYRELRTDDDGVIKVLAADVDTVDGVRPTLALIDEQARAKTSELYAVLRDGLGPRGGQLVCISTAGDDEASVLGQLRRDAYAMAGFQADPLNPKHRFVETRDFGFHEWALDPTDDPTDVELLKLANPAPWQTLEELRRRVESPTVRPWELKRFAAGIWTFGEDAAISDVEWRACGDPTRRDLAPTADNVHIGLDIGYRQDPTAFVPIAMRDGVAVVGRARLIYPPGDGTSIRVDDIVAVAAELVDLYPNAVFVFDPQFAGETLAQRIADELGPTIAEHSQKPLPMATAAERLTTAIANGKLTHPEDPVLTAHVLAGVAKPVGESFRFVRGRKSGAKIDALIALAIAHSTLVAAQVKPKSKAVHFL